MVWYTTKQAAQYLNVSSSTITRWDREGKLGIQTKTTQGGHRRYPLGELEKLKMDLYEGTVMTPCEPRHQPGISKHVMNREAVIIVRLMLGTVISLFALFTLPDSVVNIIVAPIIFSGVFVGVSLLHRSCVQKRASRLTRLEEAEYQSSLLLLMGLYMITGFAAFAFGSILLPAYEVSLINFSLSIAAAFVLAFFVFTISGNIIYRSWGKLEPRFNIKKKLTTIRRKYESAESGLTTKLLSLARVGS